MTLAAQDQWMKQPGAIELMDGLLGIDRKLYDATLIAFRAGYTVAQIRQVLKLGQAMFAPNEDLNP